MKALAVDRVSMQADGVADANLMRAVDRHPRPADPRMAMLHCVAWLSACRIFGMRLHGGRDWVLNMIERL